MNPLVKHTSTCCAVAATLVLAVAAVTASAAPVYHINGSIDTLYTSEVLSDVTSINQDSFDVTDTNYRSDGLAYHIHNDVQGFAQDADVTAWAGDGGMGVWATSRFVRDYATGGSGSAATDLRASANASMQFFDFVIPGPDGPVTASFNLHLSGNTGTGASPGTSSTLVAGAASVALRLYVNNGTKAGFGYKQVVSPSDPTSASANGSGLLLNFDGNDVITSDEFTVDANTPFSVRIQLGVDADGSMTNDGTGEADGFADFGNTLTFATNGPVFNLPDGYTVNSVDAGIINNIYSVPEPATIALLACGLPWLLTRWGK